MALRHIARVSDRLRGALLLAMTVSVIAGGTPSRAQTPFSCDAQFETRLRDHQIGREMRTWIAFTVRRFARTSADSLWVQWSRTEHPCLDLSCIGDDALVASVAQQCTMNPQQTLEQAAHGAVHLESMRGICAGFRYGDDCLRGLAAQQ